MGNTTSDVERAEMMLSLNMNDEGNPLSAEERAVLQQFVDDSKGPVDPQPIGNPEPSVGAIPQDAGVEGGAGVSPELIQQMIAAQLQQAGVGQPLTVEGFLQQIDPRDSETALAMYQWLVDTGRLSAIGNLHGGGYLLHYQEPKGTSKQGYMPGGTQGGRMVDQAFQQAKEAGAKPRKTGICDKCWSAVEQLDDGSVVTDSQDGSDKCPSDGGAHTFNG